MSYKDRKNMYSEITRLRNRPLICYVTSIRPNLSCNMAGDAIPSIIEQIESIPEEEKEIDFLIISNGGDPITSLRIISLLRERFDRIGVLLPYVAYSAATILSLGADEIVMHRYSNLGPIDPQLTVSHNNEYGIRENLQFSSEDLRNYVDFIRSDVGITDQQYIVSAIAPLLKEVGALSIGNAKRSQQLSILLSEKMLGGHFADNAKVKSIARTLNSSYYHHGYAVGRKEAADMGLPITFPSRELEKLLWSVWKDFDAEMKCEKPFEVIRELMDDPKADSIISQASIVDFPVNTPTDIAQKIWDQYIQNIPVTTRTAIKQRVLLASIEGSSFAKAVYNDIEIMAWRNPNISLEFNCNTAASGWINYED